MIFVENMKMLAIFSRTMYMTQFVLQVASHQLMKASNPSAGQTLLSYKHLKWEGDVSRPVLMGLESSSGGLWLTSAGNGRFVAEWQVNPANISKGCSEQRL